MADQKARLRAEIVEGARALHRVGAYSDDDLETTTVRMRVPTHPGTILLEDFMNPAGLTSRQLAKQLKVPPNRISQIVRGAKGVTAETALLLAERFGTTPEFWINLQSAVELASARETRQASSRRRSLATP